MTTPNSNIEALVSVVSAGEAAAKLDTTPGNFFRGAFKATTDAGLDRESVEGRVFMLSYLSECPKSVNLDAEGKTLGDSRDEVRATKVRAMGAGLVDL